MSAILDAFKVKPFDLEPVYKSWTDAPMFGSKKCKDLAVNDWLKIIKAGCQARHVPKEYWHKVAQHYMDPKSRERIDALKRVVENMTGDKYKWNWRKYKMAMRNLGWELDSNATETVKVKARPGVWWTVGRNGDKEKEKETATAVSKEGKGSLAKVQEKNKSKESFFLNRTPSSRRSIDSDRSSTSEIAKKPQPKRAATMTVATVPTAPKHDVDESTELMTLATAPIWLLNAAGALDYLTSEHPRVMTAMSAILITVGSIPAIPAISAGAGGAILASGVAQAVGAAAVGLGSWIKAQTDASGRPTPNRALTSPV